MANEIDLDFGSLNLDTANNIAIKDIRISETKPVKISNILRKDGAKGEDAKRKELIISLIGDIAGTDYDNLRTNLDTLKAGLQDGSQKFTIDDDRYIMAQLKTFEFKYTTLRTLATWKASFIAKMPFWITEGSQSSDSRTPSSGVAYTVTNSGGAEVLPEITIKADQGGDVTAVLLENLTTSKNLSFTGTIASGKELVIDCADMTVENDGTDDLGNFAGDFFGLAAGANSIEYTGSAGSVEIKWYMRWH